MDHERTIRNLRLQLLVERSLIGIFAVFLIASWLTGRLAESKSLIIVDGKPIACVKTERDADAVLASLKRGAGCSPNEVEFRQEVRVARAPHDARPTSRHMAMRAARSAISPVVRRWAVIVDGKPVVALPSRREVGKTLDLAKTRFGKLAKNLREEPQFKENVKVETAPVDPAIYRATAEEAVRFLFEQSPPVARDAVYVVRKGDVAGEIARSCGLSLSRLWGLNPGVNLNRLQIGDQLRTKKIDMPKPRLTVIVRDVEERTEVMRAPLRRVSSAALYAGKTAEISAGRSGLRRVRMAVICENGRKVASEMLDEEVLREPRPRSIAVGIKPRPTWD